MIDAETIDQLNQHFQKNGLPISLAELQGMIFGYLAIQKEPCFQSWLALCDDLLNWPDLIVDNQEQIKQLFLSAHMELRQGTPLSIALSASAQTSSTALWDLIDWARGFLYGFGVAGASPALYLQPQIKEIIDDFTAFSQIEISHQDMLSAEELQDYHEILAHIQASVPIIYQKAQSAEFEGDEN